MHYKPILIIQMQRMGDLILSFPLVSFLAKTLPQNPLWVVAEEKYFSDLMPISPKVTYFPYTAAHLLKNNEYYGIINLSHRLEASRLMKDLKTKWHYGYYLDKDDKLRINGVWQVYRSSLTHNNQHNRYHWSDLNLLDVIQDIDLIKSKHPQTIEAQQYIKTEDNTTPSLTTQNNKTIKNNYALPHYTWNLPKKILTKNAYIALFVGASQPEKHPNTDFFASLVLNLLKLGHKPVLLGGKAEKKIGAEICNKLGNQHGINLCGNFSIAELVNMLKKVDLFICPDTGPLHLANLLGIPTLNLSLGNVSAFETGPSSPGHFVLSSNLSCVGCWHCEHNLQCHKHFNPIKIAQLTHEIVCGREHNIKRLDLNGLKLFKTDRINQNTLSGLYLLTPILTKNTQETYINLKTFFSEFWQNFFYEYLSNHLDFNEINENLEFKLQLKNILEKYNPKLLIKYNNGLLKLCRYFSSQLNLNKKDNSSKDNFWKNYPPCIRPLSSFCQLWLENSDYSKESYTQVLRLTECAFIK